ncbi:hypothetical protein HFO33_35380 [Rhizobium leguminosarum]|uniref:hypothetical protein n=1 Tax=Rhizobium leguminosarum TaxID=384 RepID=UPI001C93DEB5|nr:hypothetical protein [Rhizobium leguminosarum]MBY5721775.1 hypothetical protein [Rhizobium leguminosarum]
MSAIRFHRVPFETAKAPDAGALIRIFRLRGNSVATVTRYEWFEPDGHEHTGYIDEVSTESASAASVVAEFRKQGGQVALENDSLWDPMWGVLG